MKSETNIHQIPPELYKKHIFKNLELDDLLSCRLVCKNWKHIADDIISELELSSKFWSPYFNTYTQAGALSRFLQKSEDQQFITGDQIDQFILQHERSEDPSRNPFPNHTLVLCCRSTKEYAKMCKKFPKLVKFYGHHVHHCLYSVHNEVSLSVKNIPLIFTMKNLKSLEIYCAAWDVEHPIFRKWDKQPFTTPTLEKFKSLSILGHDSYTVVNLLFKNYGSQIKRLYCQGEDLSCFRASPFVNKVTKTFGNLEEFKISNATNDLIALLCDQANWSNLKRISIMMKAGPSTGMICLSRWLSSLSKFSGSLESLHFQAAKEDLVHGRENFQNIFFAKLTTLLVPVYFIEWGMTYFYKFMKNFPALRRLEFVDSQEYDHTDIADKAIFINKMYEIMKTLKEMFPAGIKTSVRYRKHNPGISGTDNCCPLAHQFAKANSKGVVYEAPVSIYLRKRSNKRCKTNLGWIES